MIIQSSRRQLQMCWFKALFLTSKYQWCDGSDIGREHTSIQHIVVMQLELYQNLEYGMLIHKVVLSPSLSPICLSCWWPCVWSLYVTVHLLLALLWGTSFELWYQLHLLQVCDLLLTWHLSHLYSSSSSLFTLTISVIQSWFPANVQWSWYLRQSVYWAFKSFL